MAILCLGCLLSWVDSHGHVLQERLQGSSVLANARSWGVKILFVDGILLIHWVMIPEELISHPNDHLIWSKLFLCVWVHVKCSEPLLTADGTMRVLYASVSHLCKLISAVNCCWNTVVFTEVFEKLVLFLNVVTDVILYLKHLTQESFGPKQKRTEVSCLFSSSDI